MVRPRVPTLESLFIATFGLLGLRLGSLPIGDNSAFVHIRTGIDIVAGRGIPRTDPYSFTAAGEPWVVQSWLASVVYGLAESLGGMSGVLVVNGLLMGLLAVTMAAVARTGVAVRTFAAAGLAIGVGVAYWAPRPLVFGLLGLALTVLVVERRLSPWWLVPVGWVWVNTHGSFVLGALWVALRLTGEWLDGRPPRGSGVAAPLSAGRLRVVGALLLGFLAGAVNPLGPALLTFPFRLGERQDQFREILEWQSPDFQSPYALTSLIFLAIGVGVLLRRRVPWCDLLPVGAFVVAALIAQRNVPVAAVVLAPAIARALRPSAVEARPTTPHDGEAPEPVRPPFHVGVAALLGVLAALFIADAVVGEALDLGGYPSEELGQLDAAGFLGAGTRLAHPDVVGGLLIFHEGRAAEVFIDDRYDMYPVAVTADYLTLVEGEPGALEVLDRHAVDVVLWPDEQPLTAILDVAPGWETLGLGDEWRVFVRRRGRVGG